MKVNSKVFRAYDVRGVVGKELSDELIEKFKLSKLIFNSSASPEFKILRGGNKFL